MSVPPRSPDDAPDWEALARFLAGEIPASEASAVEAWLAAHPEDEALVRSVNAAADHLAHRTGPPIDTEAALARVLARRDAPDVTEATTATRDRSSIGGPTRGRVTGVTHPSGRPRRATWLLPLAAAAAVAIVATSARWWGRTPVATDATTEAPSATTIATGAAQRDSLTLPDGTAVVLGPQSVLSYAPAYGDASREVTLEGTAWFVVERDDARPFTVRAGGTRVVDLGTAFTVRTDAGDGVEVVVARGRVRLEGRTSDAPSLELAAGEAGRLPADLDRPERVARDTADALAWTQGRLVLRDTPVRALPDELRRWYGIVLTVDDAFLQRRVSATFTREPLDDVIAALALSLGARGTVRGDSAFLTRADAR